MNLCIKILRYLFLSVLVFPIWVLACILGFFATFLLHILYFKIERQNEKYRNNRESIYKDFKNNVLLIFCYY
jgi:hypothetical protein